MCPCNLQSWIPHWVSGCIALRSRLGVERIGAVSPEMLFGGGSWRYAGDRDRNSCDPDGAECRLGDPAGLVAFVDISLQSSLSCKL